jgi:hypothetical protein
MASETSEAAEGGPNVTPTLLHDPDVQTDIRTEPAAVDAAGCPVCPHPMAEHDAIAQRYCRATQDSALDRGCACG